MTRGRNSLCVLAHDFSMVWIPITVLMVTCLPAMGQDVMSGQVTDQRGRPLPFTVVTSRTRNGFLSTYTDLDGRFVFRDRPHRLGDIISFGTVGYARHSSRVQDAAGDIVVALTPARVGGMDGWSIGLPVDLHVRLLSVDGSVIDPLSIRSHEAYRLEVVTSGRAGCFRGGPSALDIDGTNVTVAVADFSRRYDCGNNLLEHKRTFELSFDRTGAGSIRTIGRYEDYIVTISVTDGSSDS